MDDRIFFKLEFQEGRLHAPAIENAALEVDGATLNELKRKLDEVVRLRFGDDRGFTLLIG